MGKYLILSFVLFCFYPVTTFSTEPPIVLPPIKVVGTDESGNSIEICLWADCTALYGSQTMPDFLTDVDVLDPEGMEIEVPIMDLDNHPNNSNPLANCTNNSEVREAHVRQDLGYHLSTNGLTSIPRFTAMKQTYDNGDTEIWIHMGTTVPPKAVPGTCVVSGS